jgi:hypothetical protein
MEGLLTLLLSEKLGVTVAGQADAPRSAEAEALREQIRQSMQKAENPQTNPEKPAA